MVNCKNCETSCEDNYKFCPNCAQPTDTKRIDFHFLIHEIQHRIFHVDKGIFYTLKELFTRPGYSIREYIEGKRQKHFKPILLIMILGASYAILQHNLKVESFSLDLLKTGNRDEILFFQKFVDYIRAIEHWIDGHYAMYFLLQIPLVGLGFYWGFKKYHLYNYAEWLVIMTFMGGQMLAVSIVESLFDMLTLRLGILFFLAEVGLVFWTIIQLFQYHSKVKVILRTLVSLLISAFFILLVVTIVMAIGVYKSGGMELMERL